MKNIKRKSFLALILLFGVVNFYCSAAKKYVSDENIPVRGETSISLPSDKAGGYEWVIGQNSDPKVLEFLSKEFIDEGSGKGKEKFKFKGLKKGTVEVILNYMNKSQSPNKVFKTETFSVTVR